MIYKALVSFAGNNISMRRNETREIKDNELTAKLVKAGYLTPVESTGSSEKPKSAKRSSKAAESKES